MFVMYFDVSQSPFYDIKSRTVLMFLFNIGSSGIFYYLGPKRDFKWDFPSTQFVSCMSQFGVW